MTMRIDEAIIYVCVAALGALFGVLYLAPQWVVSL